MSLVGSEPKRIIKTFKANIVHSVPKDETDVAAQFARARHVDDSWLGETDVLPKRAGDDHVDDEPHENGMDEE